MDINDYFSKLNYDEIKRKINEFDNLKFENHNDNELLKRITDIFTVDNQFCNPIYTIEVPTSECYCRIRKNYDYLEAYLKNKKFDQYCIYGKPNPNIGRMNNAGENGLYLSKKLKTAIAECRVKKGEIFTCGVFKFDEPLKILLTFVSNKYYDVDKIHENKAEILNNFLYKYLTKKNEDNNIEVYRITNLFNKIFLEYIENDGYLYTSSVDNSYNLFVKENSIFKCKLNYIFVGRYVEKGIQIMEFLKIKDGKIIPEDVLEKDEILAKLM